MDDLISRAVEMDAIQDAMPVDPMTGSEITKEQALRLAQVCITLNRLLSAHPELDTGMYADGFADGYRQGKKDAQPEPLTDKEQRIFLAAMAKEEKVCAEVDRNYVREPYEDSLMSVCREIERKVKGALWT